MPYFYSLTNIYLLEERCVFCHSSFTLTSQVIVFLLDLKIVYLESFQGFLDESGAPESGNNSSNVGICTSISYSFFVPDLYMIHDSISFVRWNSSTCLVLFSHFGPYHDSFWYALR